LSKERKFVENKISMSDTVFYIVVFVVVAHFVAGFVFLVKKLSGPVSEEPWDETPYGSEEEEVG
jgi:NADH:ubiquinone oxidoreductase subunit 3 (subunit A)